MVAVLYISCSDDNNMIGHVRNRATINKLTDEINAMKADSAFVQNKLDQFMGNDVEVFEDEARSRGWLKSDEEVFIIEK
jgi:hypothetical protein